MTKKIEADEYTKFIDRFRLHSCDFRSIVERAVGRIIKQLRIKELRQLEGNYGYQGEKILPVIYYETEDGETGEIELFAKLLNRVGAHEAVHYHYLDRHGISVPRCYGSYYAASGEETLFMERLPRTGANFENDSELKRALQLLAEINTLPVSAEYRAYLPPGHKSHSFDWEKTVHEIWEYAAKGEIGEDVKLFCKNKPLHLLLTKAAYKHDAADLDCGLIHDDYHKGNIGFNANGDMVVFDLHSMSYGPRFWDIARVYGNLPAVLHPQLIQLYLHEYTAAAGITVPEVQFFEELHILYNIRRMTSLKLYLNWSLSGKNGLNLSPEEGKVYHQRLLLKGLSSFI